MRNWLAAILLILHTGLSMSGYTAATVSPGQSQDGMEVAGFADAGHHDQEVPPTSQQAPRSESQEIPETGEADPDYCNHHQLLMHTGLHAGEDIFHTAVNHCGKPSAVSVDIHTPPPEMMG